MLSCPESKGLINLSMKTSAAVVADQTALDDGRSNLFNRCSTASCYVLVVLSPDRSLLIQLGSSIAHCLALALSDLAQGTTELGGADDCRLLVEKGWHIALEIRNLMNEAPQA